MDEASVASERIGMPAVRLSQHSENLRALPYPPLSDFHLRCSYYYIVHRRNDS